MTPDQKAAFINAQIQMMIAERREMEAENLERARQNLAPAYGPESWKAFQNKWEPVLGYNSLILFFRD
jgi:hypothetical protein